MKLFAMYRRKVPATHNNDQKNSPDEIQFEGVVFDDGRVVIRWMTAKRSTSVWDNLDDMMAIHGHPEYQSELVWYDIAAPKEAVLDKYGGIEGHVVCPECGYEHKCWHKPKEADMRPDDETCPK